MKLVSVIQPAGCATPMQKARPSLLKCSLNSTLQKTHLAGTVLPHTFIVNSTLPIHQWRQSVIRPCAIILKANLRHQQIFKPTRRKVHFEFSNT